MSELSQRSLQEEKILPPLQRLTFYKSIRGKIEESFKLKIHCSMSHKYFSDEDFSSIDFSKKKREVSDYEQCIFTNCIFSNCDLSDFSFEDCEFNSCDFSNTKLSNTAFKTVHFKKCKLIGLPFDTCNPFLLEFRFTDCLLNYSSFYQLKIKETRFASCKLQETDFTETDLRLTSFKDCDLTGALFHFTKLQKADLRSSVNFSIDPEQNQISGAKFSIETLGGLLNKYNIHIE